MSSKRKAGAELGSAASASTEKRPRAITSFFASDPAKKPPATAKTAFDKEEWVKSLSSEEKELLKLEIDTLHESWLAVLKDTIRDKTFLNLKRFLKKEKEAGAKIFPPEQDIYSWSRHTPLDTVKVVILGQDPYHNVNQAHGLSFSVRPPTPAPPSLKNIYTALSRDFPSFKPPPKNGGLLTPWAERGVLMLNACLTVKAHTANSHSGRGWEMLTEKAIDAVAQKRLRGVVFMAWGSPAAKRVTKIDKNKHLVLYSVHPSPLSAYKGPVTFFDAQHFKKANEWLETRYDNGAIDWNAVNPEGVSLFPKRKLAKGNDKKEEEAGEKKKTTVESVTIEKKVTKVTKKDEFDDDDDDDDDDGIDWDAAEKTLEKVENEIALASSPVSSKVKG